MGDGLLDFVASPDPSLGVPGSSNWKLEFAAYLEGLEIYAWHDGDAAGDQLAKAVASSFEDVKVVEAPTGAKDPFELYLQAGDQFKETVEDLLRAARPMSELRSEAFTREARDLLLDAGDLLEDPGFLDRLSTTIREMGFAGDARPALIAFVAVTGRLLGEPNNVAYILQSASGKNAAPAPRSRRRPLAR